MKAENRKSPVNKGYLNFFIIFWLGVLTGALAVGLALLLNGYALKDAQSSLFNWPRFNWSQNIPTPPGGIVDFSIPTPPGGIVRSTPPGKSKPTENAVEDFISPNSVLSAPIFSIPTPPGGIVYKGSTLYK